MSEPITLTASIGTRGATIHVRNDANHPLTFSFYWPEHHPELKVEGPALARLIIAAPDLLTQLQEAVTLFEHDVHEGSETVGGAWLIAARAAIEKATPARAGESEEAGHG